ncbi:ribosomal RNA small subunit methyltransferase A [Candidatus Kaiserbacteria bacterium CG10_big_fil_rev_8_21_14_0_10_59_10]|uniref:Ribosomal RNA small subunit methyltransferase A n=1 Tax=Candidatus Kaiserbacteria bacterium CG10_big_fil_rev_8_21_14_0_10_59_10 TaxID=1974612 RepID=A0A2H0U810_9BACT|nr:MAG: ribosomal RNA small subunit methyltransferase A [Candidatus Kaiserbacteria bacterium CG10_big_fil_rev_8_21_14_0_10_59_10]
MGQRLGQHFLKNRAIARAIARAVPLREGECVLEIGPGRGVLTRELLALGARVVAVEKDAALVEYMRDVFADDIASRRLTLIEDDIRNFDPARCGLHAAGYTLAANIPYYITGEILRRFLTAEAQPRAMTLLVQKEVARRIATSAKESILSLSVKAYGTPRLVRTVGRGNFSPPPDVDSAILTVTDISKAFFADVPDARFFDIVHAGFSSKRKLLASNLSHPNNIGFTKPNIIRVFEACGIPEKARAEDVPLEAWRCLARVASSR